MWAALVLFSVLAIAAHDFNDEDEVCHIERLRLARMSDQVQKLSRNLKFNDNAASQFERTVIQIEKRLQEIDNKIEQKLVTENCVPKPTTPECLTIKRVTRDLNMTHLTIGSFYYHTKNTSNWSDARTFCKDRGLELATIKSKEEIRILEDSAPEKGYWKVYWLSATDQDHRPGRFFWSDGRAVNDDWWNKSDGEPDQFGEGKVMGVALSPYDKYLFDLPSSENYFFICQVGTELLPCFS